MPATMQAAGLLSWATPRVPTPVGQEFRVYAYDMNTNTRICEVPAQGLKFGRRLNDAGGIDFTVNLLDPRSLGMIRPLLAYFDVAPFALYVERFGNLVWGGWAKTNGYVHSAANAFPIAGKEWLDYWTQRTILGDYSTNNPAYAVNGVDPAQLIVTALTDAQNAAVGGPGSSVGISVVGPPGSTGLPWIKPSYTSTDFVGQVIADMIAGITPGTGGVDLWTDVSWGPVVNGNRSPQVTVHVMAPRAGRIAGQSNLCFELLAADDFTWPNDVTPAATTLAAEGGGSGQVAPSTVVQAPGVAVGGLGQPPRLDKVIQHTNVLDQAALQQIAQGEAQRFAPLVPTPTVTIGTSDPANPFGKWIVADDARLRCPPIERFPGGIDMYWRIVADEVDVPDQGRPTVTLTYNPPPSY